MPLDKFPIFFRSISNMQQNANKTITQLSNELRELRQRYTELESSSANLKKSEPLKNIRTFSEGNS